MFNCFVHRLNGYRYYVILSSFINVFIILEPQFFRCWYQYCISVISNFYLHKEFAISVPGSKYWPHVMQDRYKILICIAGYQSDAKPGQQSEGRHAGLHVTRYRTVYNTGITADSSHYTLCFLCYL
jgi:hypothetical protein